MENNLQSELREDIYKTNSNSIWKWKCKIYFKIHNYRPDWSHIWGGNMV